MPRRGGGKQIKRHPAYGRDETPTFAKDITTAKDVERGKASYIHGEKGAPVHGHTVVNINDQCGTDVSYARDNDGKVVHDDRSYGK